MNWQQFTMRLGSLPPELVEEIFERHGACSVTLSDAGDDPVLEPAPGATPLWNDTQITGLFDKQCDMASLQADLLQTLRLDKLSGCRVDALEERAWEREWLKDFRPMKFGNRLWVCPGEFRVDEQAAVVISLDPGLAFGTGTHPTTALCLEWLDSQELRDKIVFDYGCGSGILAIAALLLGARSAVAMDIDPQALLATQQNALRNSVQDRLVTAMSGDEGAGQFDVLVANILAAPLIEYANAICRKLRIGGRLALSGILHTQADSVRDAFAKWISFEPVQRREDWILLTGRRT
ncbi:MAG: 50S ribosomal protein L11 methyltransferase [Woeseiaceae bacterium]